jgi:2-polyprenyl-3-methyl-5-hydroxy-6-metoxy-1,4-benzoquinol methylase
MLQNIRHALGRLRREYARTRFRSQLPQRGYANNRVVAEWVDTLSDEDLFRLNGLLDWQCFTADSQGRRFGSAAWQGKRAEPQVIPDERIVLLNQHFDLSDKRVLEIGCFEGIHTIGLAQFSRQVTAIDARIENVVKTIVRCSFFGFTPCVFKCDIEREPLPINWLSSDILHHVGVLYHLKDPVRHLLRIGQYVRLGLMLDTHYCRDEQADQTYEVEQRSYRYREYTEQGLTDPFSGMHEHAKWLRQDDIIALLRQTGFQQVDVIETREERNGPRLLLIAKRLQQ